MIAQGNLVSFFHCVFETKFLGKLRNSLLDAESRHAPQGSESEILQPQPHELGDTRINWSGAKITDQHPK